MTTEASLEERVARLEAKEAIKELKALYCDICDDGHNPERIVKIFVQDGVWESATRGRAVGHQAIRERFESFRHSVSVSHHMVMNPMIVLSEDGRSARATWNFASPMTFDGTPSWMFVRYDDEYVRVGEDWLVRHMCVRLCASGPQPSGWIGYPAT